jgi:CubicO group peptidase (beta-lactamase class C family)
MSYLALAETKLSRTLHTVSPSEVEFDPGALAHVHEVIQRGLGTVFPAAVLLVARHGGTIIHRAYGYLDPETCQRPVQLGNLFDLASLTKLFTATAFLTLVETGRVTLDTPVSDVLPEFGGVRLGDAVVPTEWCAWRRRRCAGEVHDENAASLGGIAGHAGLFATAHEVAVLGQMYLNRGHYGTARVLSPQTVAQMTSTHVNDGDTLRGLAWMRRSQHGSSSGRHFGPRSYGHTGFTGTSLWVDPDRELLVALLTNRVYYGRDPTGIARLRPELHDAVVEAIR